jgi:hypothetical protein
MTSSVTAGGHSRSVAIDLAGSNPGERRRDIADQLPLELRSPEHPVSHLHSSVLAELMCSPWSIQMRQVWRLVDQSGTPAHCFLKERDGRWLVFVRAGDAITLYNRCSSDETAVQRANQIRQLFTRLGWQEPGH